ncbi:MAG: bacteriohemerythrin [Rhodospirillaceae bacterium]
MDHLKPIQWTDSLSVGVKLVDDEHKLLLSIFNDLVNALRTSQPLSVAKRIVEELAGYTTYHFAHEEELMTAFRYPDFDAHHREHDKLTAKLMEIDQNVLRGKGTITDVIQFANALVSGHFLHTDAKMAEYLRTRMPSGYLPFEFNLDHGDGGVAP